MPTLMSARSVISTGTELDEGFTLWATNLALTMGVVPGPKFSVALWERLPPRYRGFWREKIKNPLLEKITQSRWATPEDFDTE